MNFYTAAGLGLAGAIVIFCVAAYYYNRKWVPNQNRRGKPAQPLTRLANNMFKNGYSSKEPFEWLKNKAFDKMSYKLKKVFSLRNFNIALNLITVILLALQNENWWLIPVIQTIANVIAYAPKHQARNRILNKMCEAAHKKLHWGPQALLAPWVYVQISEWDGNNPIKVVLKLSTDYDSTNPATKDSFERQFNAVVSDKNSWSYEWNSAEGTITVVPVALLPERADYEGSGELPWNQFAVGVGIDGPVFYDIEKYPHVLVGGTTGSGKSVLQRNIIFHCIQHNYMWRFLGVDLKRVELGPFKKYDTTVMGIASELEDGVEIVRYAQRVMNTRYSQMEEAGVNHFKNLIDPQTGKTKERALLIMVDEAAMFMGTENVKTDEGKARDELHGEAVGIIGTLARLGRAAGVHLLLATQRPDATFIPGETKNNLDVRIAAGRLDSTPSSMILDNGAATMLPGHIKGRGVIRYAGQNQEFQGYYAEPEWIDEWLAANPGVEPTINPAPGQITDEELDDLPPEIDFEDGILSLEADIMSPDLEKFAEQIEESLDEEELEELPEKKKKSLFGKKSKSEAQDGDESETLNVETEEDPFLDDDDYTAETEHIEEEVVVPEEQPELTAAEQAILNKMKETFGEDVMNEELSLQSLNPLEDFEIEETSSGIPAFTPESGKEGLLPPPERVIPQVPKLKPPTFPAPTNTFTPPKDFPAPNSEGVRKPMNLPPPPKGFPPPPNSN